MDKLRNIYMDYAATTPIDPRVFAAMTPYFSKSFGNPSSIHYYGQEAEAAIENARIKVAASLNCLPEEIIFTGSGTESDNLAIRGVAHAKRKATGANHLLISPVEHHAVSQTARQLEEDFGFELEYLPVDRDGSINPDDVAHRLRDDTALVSVIYANNEIGTINPIREIGDVCFSKGVPFHTDAVQAAAHINLDLNLTPVTLMSLGAHKFYGPKGVGVLFCRKGYPISPIITGGGQEFGLRAGTQNVPYIVGLADALSHAQKDCVEGSIQMRPLIARIIETVIEEIPGSYLTGHSKLRLPNHASFVFDGINGNELLMLLDIAGFACSSGSACKTGNPVPSEVLIAIGVLPSLALGSLRITLGMGSTLDQVELFLSELPKVIAKARNLKLII